MNRWMIPVIAAGVACDGGPVSPERPPDVLLVILDTVRTDALSTYGAARPTSPQLDAIAAAGVRFDDVTAPGSWTWPVHASLFTGLQPWEHGAHYTRFDDGGGADAGAHANVQMSPLRGDVPTLAERFTAAGYQTALVTGNPVIGPGLGMDRGFEGSIAPGEDGAVVAAAVEAIRRDDPRPLLLVVNLFGAHAPWVVQPASWVGPRARQLQAGQGQDWVLPYVVDDGKAVRLYEPSAADPGTPGTLAYVAGELDIPPDGQALLRDLYDGEVMRVDYQLNRLVEAWNGSGRGGGVIAVTSDHGEYLGERRMLAHGRTLYPEVTRVPLVIAAPGRLPAGVTISTPVMVQDLHDTLLDLAGLEAGTGSLSGVIQGGARHAPVAAAAWPDPFWADRLGGRWRWGWRLIRDGSLAGMLGDDGSMELYDLAVDPGMNTDLAAERPAEAARVAQAIREAIPDLTSGDAGVRADASTIEALQALGYVAEPPPTEAAATP